MCVLEVYSDYGGYYAMLRGKIIVCRGNGAPTGKEMQLKMGKP